MNLLRIVLIVAIWALAGPVLPQTGERASTPPGASQDGSRPADGAIKGGSILPGERSGVPGKTKCEELTGSLREDCLKQERQAGVGGTVTTPPQNPNPVQR